jgi:epoxyqueuosine reductase QueG
MEVLSLGACSERGKLTADVKEVAVRSGASLVGVVSTNAIDAFPAVHVGWTIQEYTKKTSEVMPEARSIVVMGYHVWDDMLELAIRKGDVWIYPGYLQLDVLTLEVNHYLQRRGYKAAYARSISHKRLAQLAGFGNYGKNALIVNPVFGPWIRIAAVLTNAELITDNPFEQDLCQDCDNCIKACPVGALTPYKVDDQRCMLGVHLTKGDPNYYEVWKKYEPSLTKNSHLMCTECQKACKYGKNKR